MFFFPTKEANNVNGIKLQPRRKPYTKTWEKILKYYNSIINIFISGD